MAKILDPTDSLSEMATDSLSDLARALSEIASVRPEHVCGENGWKHWDDDLAEYYGLT